MNKPELLKAIKEKTGAKSMAEVDAFLKATEEVVKERMAMGDVVTVLGVKFDTKTNPARVWESPLNGQTYSLPEKRVPRVKAMKSLKDALI